MTKQTIRLRDGETFIKLGQALKAAGAVSSGVEAKLYITDEAVTVNGTVDTRRGRKCVVGDVIRFADYEITIVA